MHLAGGALSYLPGSFGIARVLSAQYSLRCIVFHNISESESPYTRGLGVTVTPRDFEAALRYLTKYYTPVRLGDVLADSDGRGLPLRPVLVTFDDAYASVSELAGPLCRKFGVPVVFFINAACLDNRRVLLDNLVCYVANVFGLGSINSAIRFVRGSDALEVHFLDEVFSRFLPIISLAGREAFRDALLKSADMSESEFAEGAGLYLSSQQVRDLALSDFEIGNHTYTHVSCRSLSAQDILTEVDKNKAVLEAISGTEVRSFSVPYGSSADLSTELVAHLQRSGHKAAFLVESHANPPRADPFCINRVSTNAGSDAALFSEIEVLPRLRTIANRCSASRVQRHDQQLAR